MNLLTSACFLRGDARGICSRATSRRILIKGIGLAVLCFVAGLSAATPEKGKAELRKLAKLPTVNLQMKFGITSERGFALTEPAPEMERQIAALQKRIEQEPSNGLLQLTACELLTALGRRAEASNFLAKARSLLRREAEAQPGAPAIVAGFARALNESGERDEAERVLRAAIKRSPNEWQLWTELGRVVSDHAQSILVFGIEGAKHPAKQQNFIAAVLERKPSAEDVTRTRELREEAAHCFDRAVELSPQSPEVYLARAGNHSIANMFTVLIEELGKREPDPRRVTQALFSRAGLRDLLKVGELSPTNYLAIGTAAMLEVYAVAFESGGSPVEEAMLLDRLPASSRTVVRTAMTQLEDLEEHSNRAIAAGALELLGGLQFLVARDLEGARKTLARAVKLDPLRHQAWDLLLGVTFMAEKPDALIAVAEERRKALDTPRNRLLLAKAYDTAGNTRRAREIIQDALKVAPEDPRLILASVALQLREGKDAGDLTVAKSLLIRWNDKLEHLPEDDREGLETESILLGVIILALDGESEEARQIVRRFLEKRPNHEHARKILAALAF